MPDELPPEPSTEPFAPSDRASGGTVPSPGLPEWASDPDARPEPFTPPTGGRYQPQSFHKPGGMGRVWRAWDDELGRHVALKEIRPKFADSAIARRRFVLEAEVTGRLEHPAVIPVYGLVGKGTDRPHYAMRFVEGRSLYEAVAAFHAAGGPSGAARAVALRRLLSHFVTVCRAIAFAHSRGIIHRDLKPQNVMVGEFGETLVVDWGLAKQLGTNEVDMPVVNGELPVGLTHALRDRRLDDRFRSSPPVA